MKYRNIFNLHSIKGYTIGLDESCEWSVCAESKLNGNFEFDYFLNVFGNILSTVGFTYITKYPDRFP